LQGFRISTPAHGPGMSTPPCSLGTMPRTARASKGGVIYHVLNRGNRRAAVFHNETDYSEFERAIGLTCDRLPMPVLAYCLMPNHFHLVLLPHRDGDLSDWMRLLLNIHVRRHHKRHGTDGRIWQGRFKAFPVCPDNHLLRVTRYVERNALRANLVARAEDWRWGSLHWLAYGLRPAILVDGPLDRPDDWLERVNTPETPEELQALRRSTKRGSPFGPEDWVEKAAVELGLEFTMREQGRPRKKEPTRGEPLKF